MIDSVGAKLDLQELGTRYDHYMEMKEAFMLGIDVLDRMRPGYVSEADKALKAKLVTTVEVINKRLDYLSDFADKTGTYSALARQIEQAGKHVTPTLTEGSNGKPQSFSEENRSKNSGDKTDLS
jgi:predicted DNA-binding protein